MNPSERYIYLVNFLNAKQKTSDYSDSMPAQSFPVSRTVIQSMESKVPRNYTSP
ncbi:hypothetical protein NC653_039243 [Populus alba x Populus x berolinensis]|uniref:Uncharacterized protein n=1 Tax=Populus alba x Populus x berolinensis TaxID=444605 RepID=A0AAD6PQA5_9ROSI|nr:hypothetical protein NC653_039243 [Populus alba x Populus x berolinensis]